MASAREMHAMNGSAARVVLSDATPARAEDAPVSVYAAGKWPLDFDEVYEQWFDEVSRWIHALGGPAPDRRDLARDVFVVVYRRLRDFDGRNLPGWLFQIARHRVRDYRRLAAIKDIFSTAPPLVGDGLQDCTASPEESLQRQKRVLLGRLLDQLSDVERSALVLFELEGYSGEQITMIQNTSINTTWARIHSARLKLNGKLASNRKHQA
jgi:RNA polymerase sigma-70 factor (ECF subfamily)